MEQLAGLKDKKILVTGQVLNSLTEMLEDYLKQKVNVLGVIGFAWPYATVGSARMSLYKGGKFFYTKGIANIYFKGRKWYSLYLLIFVFLVYFYSILRSALSFKTKFDIFVGVAGFSTFAGIVLRKLGVVRKVIFYSIDYFPPQRNAGFFQRCMEKSFFALDRFCARYSDLVWHINPDIATAREKFTGFDPGNNKAIFVPLGYGEDLLCYKDFSDVQRYTIGFVGTLNYNQGLQMAIPAFAKIQKLFPQARFEIIGDGFFAPEVKKMVGESCAREHITLHGFIGDRKKVSAILSRCALGIAPWDMDEDNNVKYADPGKPKHYAFCGLPVIMTRCNAIANELHEKKAGIAIAYDENEFIEAVSKLFRDDALFREYKKNAVSFAHDYISDNIFLRAWNESMVFLNGSTLGTSRGESHT